MEERFCWLGFSMFPNIGPKRFRMLLETFGSARDAWSADEENLRGVIGAFTEAFITFRKHYDATLYAERMHANNTVFLTWDDEAYPPLLKELPNPPIILYVKGKLQNYSSSKEQSDEARSLKDSSRIPSVSRTIPTIAIVGTRKITSYGRDVTTAITEMLVSAGFVIVSGLAMGVDAVAHTTTLESNGKTIAVLGCGIDCPSPKENALLYERIIGADGAIVSEYPFSEPPNKGSFPSRNRIIAGLSQAVIVTEGAADSGALYTAKDAFALERPVFAVPGPITSSLSKGPHSLIEKGAKVVTGAEDILKELNVGGIKGTRSTKSIKGETEEEQMIIDLLQNEQLHVDEIGKRLQKDSAAVSVLLSIMEMKGMIKSTDGGVFSIAP